MYNRYRRRKSLCNKVVWNLHGAIGSLRLLQLTFSKSSHFRVTLLNSCGYGHSNRWSFPNGDVLLQSKYCAQFSGLATTAFLLAAHIAAMSTVKYAKNIQFHVLIFTLYGYFKSFSSEYWNTTYQIIIVLHAKNGNQVNKVFAISYLCSHDDTVINLLMTLNMSLCIKFSFFF
jgi:hypothetical protein